MVRRSGACSCSDEDVVVILASNTRMGRREISGSLSSDRRHSCSGLSEQDLLPFLGDGGTARVWLASGIGTLRPGTLAHRIEPAPQVGEVVQILLLTLPGNDPGIGSHVSNAVIVAGHERAAFEMTIEHAVETVCLLDITVDRVRDFVRRVEPEMVVLSGHRPQPAHLPEQPLHRCPAAPYILWQEAT